MKKRVLALLCTLAVTGTGFPMLVTLPADAAGTGTTYYISSIRGDNTKDGRSENTAWETLDKLSGLELGPGDRVLLEKGSVFNGYIHLKDVHGTKEAPIQVSSYGAGTQKPVINAEGQGVWYQDYGAPLDNAGHQYRGYVSSAVLLYDVDFVEVSDLEITNRSDDFTFFKGADSSVKETASEDPYKPAAGRMDRTGVAGIAKDGGTMEHVYLENLYIHDVDGNIQDKHMDNGGIQLNALKPADEKATGVARYDDVKIKNCYVQDVSRAGICVGYTYQWNKFQSSEIKDETARAYGHTNVVIEDNYVKDVGNDGIVALYAHRPMIQRNVADGCGADLKQYSGFHQPLCAAVWPWKCKDAVLQYNEVFDTVNNQDGQPWDIDWSDGTVYQYNYSHNNGGGCIMFCGTQAYRGVFRYNISYNDLNGLISLAGNPKGQIYNNVFYLDGDVSTVVFRNNSSYTGVAELKNNIFYNNSANKDKDNTLKHAKRTYTNNLFYGYTDVPEGSGNITGDPLFASGNRAVGKTKDGSLHDRSAFNAYKLQEGSPAINAGTPVEGAPKQDFFGNPVGAVPDIGVYESSAKEEAKTYTDYEPDDAMRVGVAAGSVEQNSSTEGGARLALDGNPDTMWHTDWKGCERDQVWITLDLGESKPVARVKYVPRQTGGENGIFTKYKVEVRNSEKEEWKQVAEGNWAGDTETKYAVFEQVNARFVKLSGLETMSKNQLSDGSYLIFGTAAEVRAGYETPAK